VLSSARSSFSPQSRADDRRYAGLMLLATDYLFGQQVRRMIYESSVKNRQLVDPLGFAGAAKSSFLQERWVARRRFLRFGIPHSGFF
jgi:hypothetical protein